MTASSTERPRLLLEDLFADYSLRRFIAYNLHRLPFALPNVAKFICTWGKPESLASMLQSPGADVMVVRANERYEGPCPSDFAEANALSEQGYTLLIRHAELHHEGIAQFAVQFAETFGGQVDAHVYATPANHYGFAWHYDAEDVFVLQLSGEKEYSLRKNTVNPWPLAETLPLDMQYEREIMPLMRVALRAGDMLYIPCGYWHKAIAGVSSEMSVSLAIGVMSPSALDLFDMLRAELSDSILWRQRLPLGRINSNREVEVATEEMLSVLAADLTKRITSPTFRGKLENLNSTG